ncbi:MAG TPA: HAMP domain-containing sensor histidine kinase [Candidatus Limnocylindrales bacterium]|nr:HAMP domain-containing sensor histidine kinase [Candidatus Limnocylindrales bacterium]
MPDGISTPGPDRVATESLAADGRLIRDVRLRLVLWSGLSTLVVLAVLGAILYGVAAQTLQANGVQQLADRTNQIVDAIHNPGGRPAGPEYGFIFGGNSSGTFAMALDADGNNLGRGVVLPQGLPVHDSLSAAIAAGSDVRPASIGSLPIRAMTERVTTEVGDIYIQVIQDRRAEQQTLDAILRVLLVGGAVVVVVAGGFGAVYARRALVPIRESLESQRTALRRQREFAADASHELRTPLTVIRSSVEHLRRNRSADAPPASAEALDDIDAEVGHLTALVDDLLLLARSDSGAITISRLPVDLGDVAAESAGALAKLASERGVRLALDPEPAMVDGDQARLRQLVVILLDNAIRHTPRDGSVRIVVRGGEDAVLEVDDDGPGIRPEDMPRVFERFWRAPGAAAGGTGLGLAIARSIVDLHDGRITVSNRPEGGARFSVRLPAAPAGLVPGPETSRPFPADGGG